MKVCLITEKDLGKLLERLSGLGIELNQSIVSDKEQRKRDIMAVQGSFLQEVTLWTEEMKTREVI